MSNKSNKKETSHIMAELKNKNICFSGRLKTQTQAKASKVAKGFGANVSSSVTTEVDILIIGPTGAGSKLEQAKTNGIEIWTEEQFNAVIDGCCAYKKKAKKRKSDDGKLVAASSPTEKKVKIESTTPIKKATSKTATASTVNRTRKVMSAIQDSDKYEVFGDHDVKLMLSDSLDANSNKFYKLQLLRNVADGNFYVATNWGRLGESGKSQLKGPHQDEDKGVKEFSKVFKSKTKNTWRVLPFIQHDGKYQLVETTIDDTDEATADAALGRLTETQIHKGQEVLQELRSILESSKKKDKKCLGKLSNKFYSLIPTTSGRQRPPPLNNLDIVTEKEGLLEFWLRMGFEELGDASIKGSPIDGMFDLPVPKTLKVAASSISDAGSISSSKQRGTELAKTDKTKKMGPELYAAILLYTGNSIYRELNRCLRSDWKQVVKYFKYLRLYFEAMDALQGKSVTLYRGIAVDLYDEYEPGKVITWWSISSCTASKSVAQNFMNQLGGTAASFLTLHTKRACDVSAMSFYPHEQESLLRPGTKLRVLKRKINGTVVEIEVEEVL